MALCMSMQVCMEVHVLLLDILVCVYFMVFTCVYMCIVPTHECMCVHACMHCYFLCTRVCMQVWDVHACEPCSGFMCVHVHTHVWTQSGLPEAWMCLQFKDCENVMVSMATLASLAPVRALPCSSFPFTPQAPCPSPHSLSGGPSPRT